MNSTFAPWLGMIICRYLLTHSIHLMPRRIPATNDGRAVDRLQESSRINKPFKPPAFASLRQDVPQWKRKRVSYKGLQPEEDSDSDAGPSCRKKKGDVGNGDFCPEEEMLAAIKKYPAHKLKPFDQVGARRFSMPSMANKDGASIPLIPQTFHWVLNPRQNFCLDYCTIQWRITPLFCTAQPLAIEKLTRKGGRGKRRGLKKKRPLRRETKLQACLICIKA